MSPDNLFYFLGLFTISIIGGVYLLFSYKKNYLTLLNALLFFLCAVRVFTEYYLQQFEEFEAVTNFGVIHSFIPPFIFSILWSCVWFFIRPFRHSKMEKRINQLVTILFVIIPNLLILFTLSENNIYRFYPEKMEGLWKYSIAEDLSPLFRLVPFYFGIMALLMLGLLLFSIRQTPKDRLKKILLCIAFPIVPALLLLITDRSETWNTPNSGIIYLTHSILITWFLTEYRLLSKGNFDLTTDVVNSIADLVIITTPSLQIQNLNQAAAQFFAPSTKQQLPDLLAQNATLSPLEMHATLQPLLVNETEKIALSLKKSGNTNKDFEIKMTPFQKGNTAIGYTFLFTDLTVIKAKERELERLNEINQHIFSIISHDLRKPAISLRKITEKITYLVEKEDYDTLRQFSQSIKHSSVALTTLINNLLNWALNEKGMLFNEPMPVSLKIIIEEVMSGYRLFLDEKKIATSLAVPSDLYAFLDSTACHSIFSNIIDNAIKFTPIGGRISIQAERKGNQVVVLIEDSGKGIKEEKLNRIFELNKNKSDLGTNQEKGAGLGLYLVKELIESNQSTIQLENKIDTGLRVILTFPAAFRMDTKSPVAISASFP